MPVSVNDKGLANARQLIGGGSVDREGAWDFSAADGNALLGDPPDWEAYSAWFLAVDSDAEPETKEHYKYPFGKGGKVYRQAVIAAKARAAQQGEDDLATAADGLLQRIDEGQRSGAPAKGIEYRTAELRAIDDGGGFEGYVVTWGHVDSYNTFFRRGAFTKTLKERGDRIKVLWDHKEVIGKVIEAREDDVGLFVRGSLAPGVQRAAEARALMQHGTIDRLSFGFNTIRSEYDKTRGATAITEVKLYEVSPVVFPASEQAEIKAVRAENFAESLADIEAEWALPLTVDALFRTLWDIWHTGGDVLAKLDAALASFHAAYLQAAAAKLAAEYGEDAADVMAAPNALARAARSFLKGRTVETAAAEAPLSVSELRTLLGGGLLPVSSRSRLAETDPALFAAHQQERTDRLAGLFAELRAGGFSQAENTRLAALVNRDIAREPEARSAPADNSAILAQLTALAGEINKLRKA